MVHNVLTEVLSFYIDTGQVVSYLGHKVRALQKRNLAICVVVPGWDIKSWVF